MKIIKKRTDLDKGTIIDIGGKIVKLTTDYDVWHGCYEAVECEKNSSGEIIVTENEISITPVELINSEIVE